MIKSIVGKIIIFFIPFFFEEAKIEYIIQKKMFYLAQGVPRKSMNNIYKRGKEKTTKNKQKKYLLAITQHCERIKPPTMVIER